MLQADNALQKDGTGFEKHRPIADSHRQWQFGKELSVVDVVRRDSIKMAYDHLNALYPRHASYDRVTELFSYILDGRWVSRSHKIEVLAAHMPAFFHVNDVLNIEGHKHVYRDHDERVEGRLKVTCEDDILANPEETRKFFGVSQPNNPFDFIHEGVQHEKERINASIESFVREIEASTIKSYDGYQDWQNGNKKITYEIMKLKDWFFDRHGVDADFKKDKETLNGYNAYVNGIVKKAKLAKLSVAGYLKMEADKQRADVILGRIKRMSESPHLLDYLARRVAYEAWLKIVTQTFAYTLVFYFSEWFRTDKNAAKLEREIAETQKIADLNGISTSKARLIIRRTQPI
jgi:hypothetical protein